MTDPDAQLVAGAQAGDARAMTLLYRRHIESVFGYLRRRLPTREAAEDITSETFLAVVEQLRSFHGSSTFRTWVFQIARRRAAEYWRKAYRMPECAIDVVLALFGSSDSTTGSDGRDDRLRALLPRVLESLPDQHRRVLTSRFLEGKSIRETAEALSLSETNVKVIQHRAIGRAARIATSL